MQQQHRKLLHSVQVVRVATATCHQLSWHRRTHQISQHHASAVHVAAHSAYVLRKRCPAIRPGRSTASLSRTARCTAQRQTKSLSRRATMPKCASHAHLRRPPRKHKAPCPPRRVHLLPHLIAMSASPTSVRPAPRAPTMSVRRMPTAVCTPVTARGRRPPRDSSRAPCAGRAWC